MWAIILKRLGLVPDWLIWAVLGVALSAAAWGWHGHIARTAINQAVEAERARMQAITAQKLADAQAKVIEAQTNAVIAQLENEHAQAELKARAESDAAAARTERSKLLNTIAALRSRGSAAGESAGTISTTDAIPRLADALSECSGRYEEMAGVADRLVIQVTGLQRWVKEVAGPVCIAVYQP